MLSHKLVCFNSVIDCNHVVRLLGVDAASMRTLKRFSRVLLFTSVMGHGNNEEWFRFCICLTRSILIDAMTPSRSGIYNYLLNQIVSDFLNRVCTV